MDFAIGWCPWKVDYKGAKGNTVAAAFAAIPVMYECSRLRPCLLSRFIGFRVLCLGNGCNFQAGFGLFIGVL